MSASPEVSQTWPKPNYVNPEYQGPRLAIIGITLVVTSIIVVALRMFVRIHIKKAASWDDWFMVAALPFLIGISTGAIISTRLPHMGLQDGGYKGFKIGKTHAPLHLAKVLTVLSILFSYLRFFSERKYIRIVWGLLSLVLCWFITFIIMILLACIPLSNYWSKRGSVTEEGCMSETGRLLGASFSNAILDIAILVVPCPTFWRLNLPIRDRMVLIILMCLGVVSCLAGCVKSYYIYRTLNESADLTWDGYDIWVWTDIEVNFAVICTSIPILRPLIQRYLPNLGFKSSTLNSVSETRLSGRVDFNGLNSGIYKQQTIRQTIQPRQSIIDDGKDSSSAIVLSPASIPMTRAYSSSSRSYNSRHGPWDDPRP
ncbi:uncharacterized protein GIQ15_03934 [Arthroderma uncinatum]|uniref:uncharacterized protein n=1 Tax=Arthroderma uncinatum TaxID=74035 RepID=UPI00144A9DFD|nr:uncharacterized protein GIQ15_03934 [Arthroderma uncinatum]KAF3481175.1 hypothetical protein GIQ15_03934 [Arthroderma uncinatum]